MKIAVIGGGAAGFMAAITAARTDPSATVYLIEKTGKLLSKVLVSGGGRCNVTNAPVAPALFAANYPRGRKEMQQLLHTFGPDDIFTWFAQHGVRLKTEADGRVFPVTDSSSTIADCLLSNAKKAGVQIFLRSAVEGISISEGGFVLQGPEQPLPLFDRVILCSGGANKDEAYDWLRDLGLMVQPPYPSLFTFNCPGHPVLQLAGISKAHTRIGIPKARLSYEGPLLITHWGFSGPAILKLSAWGAAWLAEQQYKCEFRISWLPELTALEIGEQLRAFRQAHLNKQLKQHPFLEIPARLWNYFIHSPSPKAPATWQEAGNKWLAALTEKLSADRYTMSGKTTFKEEFVTAGGVSTRDIDFRTMECKKIPGLYIAGELLDIDGITGGYNFQCAWSTGYVAGSNAAKK